jgi:hypothetical protein
MRLGGIGAAFRGERSLKARAVRKGRSARRDPALVSIDRPAHHGIQVDTGRVRGWLLREERLMSVRPGTYHGQRHSQSIRCTPKAENVDPGGRRTSGT